MMASKSNNSKLPSSKVLRWIISLLFIFLSALWGIQKSVPYPVPEETAPPIFYSNQCDNDLRNVHVDAIRSAKKSIFLAIYSLSDSKIIEALNEQAKKGLSISVFHDGSTPQRGFHKLDPRIHCTPRIGSGLMHKKLLVVDEEKIWLGSANLTRDSLKSHDNLVVAFACSPLAAKLAYRKLPLQRIWRVGNQQVEYWSLPEDRPDALERMIELINTTQKTLRIAMFTWTHPALSEAVVKAFKRGVKVEVVMDAGQASGVCVKCIKQLTSHQVPVRLNQGSPMFHYKFALFDEKILAAGSANWTKAAFTKNEECFLVIQDLTEKQVHMMNKLWKVIRAKSTVEKASSLFSNEVQEAA